MPDRPVSPEADVAAGLGISTFDVRWHLGPNPTTASVVALRQKLYGGLVPSRNRPFQQPEEATMTTDTDRTEAAAEAVETALSARWPVDDRPIDDRIRDQARRIARAAIDAHGGIAPRDLARAMFMARLSDPNGDEAERAWMEAGGDAGALDYGAAMVLQQLRSGREG